MDFAFGGPDRQQPRCRLLSERGRPDEFDQVVVAQGVGQRGLSLHARPNVQHVGGGQINQADGFVGLNNHNAISHGRQHGFEARVVVFEGPRFRLQGVGGVRNDSGEFPDFRAAGAGERLGAFRREQALGRPPDLPEGPNLSIHQIGRKAGCERAAHQCGEDEGSSQSSAPVRRRLRGQHDSDDEHGGQHSGHRPQGGTGAQPTGRSHHPTNR